MDSAGPEGGVATPEHPSATQSDTGVMGRIAFPNEKMIAQLGQRENVVFDVATHNHNRPSISEQGMLETYGQQLAFSLLFSQRKYIGVNDAHPWA